MLLYFGKTYESAEAGGRYVEVACDKCGCQYAYELTRIGSGGGTAAYYIGTSRASARAGAGAGHDLEQRLADEAELVPCPRCNWISDELVHGYRRGRYRRVGRLAAAIGFAGTLLSLVCAWYISIGPQVDRWMLPYLLVGGPAVFVGSAVGMVWVRHWLRLRIRPNRDFPQEPSLPPGTPPALFIDPATRSVRPAKPAAESGDGMIEVQHGRHTFPALCSRCLRTTVADRGYTVQVTRLLGMAIPLCDDCTAVARRSYRRAMSWYLLVVLLVGAALFAWMRHAEVELGLILFSLLMGFVVVTAVTAVVLDKRAAPVRAVRADRARGVVCLRFKNRRYAEVVARHIHESAGADRST